MQVECLSFNFSLSVGGAVKSLSIIQKDEEQEAVGGQVSDGSPETRHVETCYRFICSGSWAMTRWSMAAGTRAWWMSGPILSMMSYRTTQ